MWSMLYFLLPGVVLGLKMPGNCPVMSPIALEYFSRGEIYGHLPFSESDSNLFMKIPRDDLTRFLIKFEPPIDGITTITLSTNELGHPYVSGSLERETNLSLTFETYIGDIPKTPKPGGRERICHPLMNETISIWIVGHIKVFYSCRSLENGYHDVAVIVAYDQTFTKTEEVMKQYMRLDFGPLPKEIVWGNASSLSRLKNGPWEFLRCSTSFGVAYGFLLVLIPILLFIVILGCLTFE